MKRLIYLLGYVPLWLSVSLPFTLVVARGRYLALALVLLGLSLWWLLRNTLNLVQGIGPVYWVTRSSTVKTWGIRRGFMRETDYPWRSGVGIQLVVPYRTFQVGRCRASKHYTQEEGLLHTLLARFLPSESEDIGRW